MSKRIVSRAALLAFALVFAGCASSPPVPRGARVIRPGDEFGFQGKAYQFLKVADEFVLLRDVPYEGTPGAMSGFLEEVFRVHRDDLGRGRWYMHPRLPGCYLQWRGGDEFTLARDEGLVRGDEVELIK